MVIISTMAIEVIVEWNGIGRATSGDLDAVAGSGAAPAAAAAGAAGERRGWLTGGVGA